MLKEFREFAVKGNMIDMAVGIIIGAAFGTVVRSLVDDILMPPIGVLIGDVDFENLFVVLRDGAAAAVPYATLADARADGAVTLNIGIFINNIVSFLIVAWAVFLLVRSINRLRRKEQVAPAVPTERPCPHCFRAISIRATRCPECTSPVEAVPA
jgi:large conductance mechanosensitive channel